MLFLLREGGQGIVEYAMILVLVALVVLISLVLMGSAIGNAYSNIVGTI